jgi:hypothetical protein
LLNPSQWGARGPKFEPHEPTKQGDHGIVYVYEYVTSLADVGNSGNSGDETVTRGVVLPSNFGRTPLLLFLNGQKAAPFHFGGYSVFEVEPGIVDLAVRYPDEETEKRFPALADSLPELRLRVEPNETYYVWGHTRYVRYSDGSDQSRLELTEVEADVALKQIANLRKQESYL